MKKYSCYHYDVKKHGEGYVYLIYTNGCPPYDDGIVESPEWYDTKAEARKAAMQKIDDFENGE